MQPISSDEEEANAGSALVPVALISGEESTLSNSRLSAKDERSAAQLKSAIPPKGHIARPLESTQAAQATESKSTRRTFQR